MAENRQQQQQEVAAQEQSKALGQETAALCTHCGAALDPEFPFCPSCGEKCGGVEKTCEYCQTKTSKEICPHCGRRVVPVPCPKCGTPSLYDACENCGEILNPVLEKALALEAPAELAVMSPEEAERINAEFEAIESDDSDEFKAFQKKLVERQILLEERDYNNKREKRIIKAFGSHPFTMELPDPEEEAFRMKAYAALERTIIAREQREIDEELERLFPPVEEIVEDELNAEIERNRAEMDRRFNEALAQVNQEVDSFRREEERKRLEEERKRQEEEERRRQEAERRRLEEERRRLEAERQRQMEIERRRLEEERRKKRFNGNYHHESHSGYLTADLSINGNRATCWYRCNYCGSATIEYAAVVNGDNITLTGGRKCGKYCSYKEYSLVENYQGSTNNSGTILTGCWHKNGQAVPIVFYKR